MKTDNLEPTLDELAKRMSVKDSGTRGHFVTVKDWLEAFHSVMNKCKVQWRKPEIEYKIEEGIVQLDFIASRNNLVFVVKSFSVLAKHTVTCTVSGKWRFQFSPDFLEFSVLGELGKTRLASFLKRVIR